MESSSEDSFAWTNTSSESIDSLTMSADDSLVSNVKNENGEVDGKRSKKRKLKESSSNSCNGIKDEYDSKLKVKVEEDSASEAHRKVKLEPDTDSEAPRKKKKKIKHVDTIDPSDDTQHSYDESFLDIKVKQEETSANVIKKKHKKSKNMKDDISLEENNLKEDFSEKYEENQQDLEDVSSKKSKKKKKKSKRKSENEELMDIDDIVEEKLTNESNIETSRINESSFTNNSQDESGYSEISAIQCEEEQNAHIISYAEGKSTKKKNDLYKSTILNQFKMDTSLAGQDSILLSGEKRKSRISDRIRFEDEDDPYTDDSSLPQHRDDKTSLKLKKYLKQNSSWQVVSQPLSSVLSDDDEVWLLRCPKEIDVEAFCNMDLNLSGKSKIKISGQAYDGSLDAEQCGTTTVLSMRNGRKEIKKLPLCGILNFRKRIPKAHVHEYNNMVNNQVNFIPLPETKCRHPLFGSNYKKAIKIPATIAEKLHVQNNEETTITVEKKKKKKHKKEKCVEESTNEWSMKSEPEPAQPAESKKKQKRKREDDDGPPTKKTKKIKHDPASADAWESEKAIEQNLFNF